MSKDTTGNAGSETPGSGAVDIDECPRRQTLHNIGRRGRCIWPCRCGKCTVCGYHKHEAVHGPYHGQPPGSEPYGHEYVPEGQPTHHGDTQ